MRSIPVCFLLGLLLGATTPIPAGALPPNFTAEEIHSDLNFPTTVRIAPDGRVFYTELSGRIAYFPPGGGGTSVTWTVLPVSESGERGLLGMAIHPAFPDSPYVYAYHTNPSPLVNRLVRITEVERQATETATLLELPGGAQVHHGGRIAFGPDGMIYVTYGDQESMADAQVTSNVRGKIHRLSRGGKAAPGNPWGTGNTATLLGVRNPFGLCFDPLEGTGYFTENGPQCDDEINLIALGANYGWGPNDFCGGQPASAFPALRTFSTPIAPTGCLVYRSSAFPSRYDGNLFFGSFNEGELRRAVFRPGEPGVIDTLDVFATFPEPVLDVTTDLYGYLYVATASGIWRIRHTPPVGVGPSSPVPQAALAAAPNPFRDRVTLTAAAAPAGTQVDILDLQGRRVRHFDAPLPPRLTWDGRSDSGDLAPPGVYLARASGPSYEVTRRLVRLAR